MDTILTVGDVDGRIPKFLEKIGITVEVSSELQGAVSSLQSSHLDLVLVDANLDDEVTTLCEYVRSDDKTSDLPIVVVEASEDLSEVLLKAGLSDVDCLSPNVKPGAVVSKIMTALRIRKMNGADEQTASLGEVNARLRELNARFAKELDEARALQQSLIPQNLPSDERYSLSVSYEPLEEVGGDWYFVEKTVDDKLLTIVADVTGHGLRAAFVGSITKLAMRAAKVVDPGPLLAEMNRLMEPNLPDGTFVTMFAYLYDPASGALKYARAGHPPALHVNRATGAVEQLKGQGFAVGFFEDSEYEELETKLGVGDILVAYTDAIPESQNLSGATYDYDRPSEVLLNSKPDATATEILVGLLDDFDEFRQDRILKDDVTVIVLKRLE